MDTIQGLLPVYEFNRSRTLKLLDDIEQLPNPGSVLAWRPGAGRAHIAWQLLHIGVTEEIFATERLAPEKAGAFKELWDRFRGGSTPDDNVPAASLIRQVLAESRAHLLATLKTYNEGRLEEIPESLKARALTVRSVLYILAYHEPHHQGQAHITLNLYKNRA